MQTDDFGFELPTELIAQVPTKLRDDSRLLVVSRPTGRLAHRKFRDFGDYMRPGDLLVLNDSRVIPARLRAVKDPSGAEVEMLLIEEAGGNQWWTLLRPGKRIRVGTRLTLRDGSGKRTAICSEVLNKTDDGRYLVSFFGTASIKEQLNRLGEIPLPPYITRQARKESVDDSERYQTVYARSPGSVAAPTAGLHFTEQLLETIQSQGIQIGRVTLHVGLGTFAPVKSETVENHVMHEEPYELSPETAAAIQETRLRGGRIFAVGTTTARVLETVAASNEGCVRPEIGRTRIFIYPPYRFQIVDALLTNFHLPRSTLLMLVSAFAAPREIGGRKIILSAYAEAILVRYRFFSYGDAMLIL